MIKNKGETANIRDIQYNKTGQAMSFLAANFLTVSENTRIPTISTLSKESGFSRGTIQNALNQLELLKAVELERHGHKGTYLRKRDIHRLVEATGRQYLSGIMPMPYTRFYEGLATGLFNTITEKAGISVDLAYMRGSRKRISALLDGKYDFAVISRYAAKLAKEDDKAIEIAMDFGSTSYLTGHVMAIANNNKKTLQPGSRVGIDHTSYDHEGLTRIAVGDVPVDYVDVNYGQITSLLKEDLIDAAVCNIDQLSSEMDFTLLPLDLDEITLADEVTAVLTIKAEDRLANALIQDFIDPDLVKQQQKEVIEGERYPNY